MQIGACCLLSLFCNGIKTEPNGKTLARIRARMNEKTEKRKGKA